MRRILALTLCLMTVFAPLAARAAAVEEGFSRVAVRGRGHYGHGRDGG